MTNLKKIALSSADRAFLDYNAAIYTANPMPKIGGGWWQVTGAIGLIH